MNISPISAYSQSPSFNALKYQNGIQTKTGLSTELQQLLARYDADINTMKHIDILVMDGNSINLGIKIPRFLSKTYERFFKEKRYDNVNNEENSFVMKKGSLINKLVPDTIPGIYNVFFKVPDNEEWKPSYPIRTLEVAKSLDQIMQDIDNAETNYGLNCVEALQNLEAMRKEEERLNYVNQVKSAYITNNEFKNMNIDELKILLEYKDDVMNIENYEIIMDEVNFPYPVLIHDKHGYLDDIFIDYYRKNGWEFERYSNGFAMRPIGRQYPDYSLADKEDHKYNAYIDFYEGGSNLGSFGREHFRQLVDLMKTLDGVAKDISNMDIAEITSC